MNEKTWCDEATSIAEKAWREMTVRIREVRAISYVDTRAIFGSPVRSFDEWDMKSGRLGPPHASWCQGLWNQ